MVQGLAGQEFADAAAQNLSAISLAREGSEPGPFQLYLPPCACAVDDLQAFSALT